MNTRNLSILSLLLCSLSTAAATPASTADAIAAPTDVYGNSAAAANARQTVNPLVYSYDEMFNFDIEAYLASQAPHLLPYADGPVIAALVRGYYWR